MLILVDQLLSGSQSLVSFVFAELPVDATTRAHAMQRVRNLPANKRGAVKVLIYAEEKRMLASSDEGLDDELEDVKRDS